MKPQVFFCRVCGEKFYYADFVCAKHQLERERIMKEWEENPGFKKIQDDARKLLEEFLPKKYRKKK